jgi:type VI secretion system protein ImpJ
MEKPLFWHQGLFLHPQHLQLRDEYERSLFTHYHTHIKPYLKGVVYIDIADSSLDAQLFEIKKGAFWFQDMTYAVIGENAVAESRNFSSHWPEGSKPLPVYLGLKRMDKSSVNVTEIVRGDSLNSVSTRFVEIGRAHV